MGLYFPILRLGSLTFTGGGILGDSVPATILRNYGSLSFTEKAQRITFSFNQPVVALGAEPSTLPAAFSLEPSMKGRGEWINTSTYILYPEPVMTGGTQYIIRLNPDLKTATGVGLEPGAASEWTFTTSLPGVVSLLPSSEQPLAIEPKILMTFNQPMDTGSVVQNFSFSGPEGSLKGSFE